jgi:hypothetical protein
MLNCRRARRQKTKTLDGPVIDAHRFEKGQKSCSLVSGALSMYFHTLGWPFVFPQQVELAPVELATATSCDAGKPKPLRVRIRLSPDEFTATYQ